MARKQVSLIVRGKVQGVFFRASTEREATRLGLVGWVRNRPDSSVELFAEGDESALNELVAWAHHGPTAARVDHVEARWADPTGELSDFRVVD